MCIRDRDHEVQKETLTANRRSESEQVFATTNSAPRASESRPEQIEVPHVKRWEGEPEPSTQTADEWRAKARAGDFGSVRIPMECYVGDPSECPRSTTAYSEACLIDLKLPVGGEVSAEHRAAFPDLTDVEILATADMMRRKATVMWREDTPQTTVVGFLHDMVVKGGPISLSLIHI